MSPREIDHFDIIKNEIAAEILNAMKSLASAGSDHHEIQVTDIVRLMEKPPERKLGDYALPCFRFTKQLKTAPQEIAAKCAALLTQGESRWIERAEAVGAFLNLFIQRSALAEQVIPQIHSGQMFGALKDESGSYHQRVMIEYSQPNTHKIFHVGHMRNVALGDVIWRLYDYCGYHVTPVNYIGDEGAHIAKCIWYIKHFNLTPEEGISKGDWLGKMYTLATNLLSEAKEDEKEQYERQISDVLRQIESKTGPIYEYWKESKEWSLEVFNSIYNWIGARFDYVFTESEVSEESQQIVEEYLQKGLFIESEGAIGLDLKPYKLGFALLRKKDGNTLYATKDLALARRKFEKYHIDKSIYVVASEQQLHFRQVFKTLELMGFEQAKQCHHLSYGLVVLPEGKMSSRAGTIVPFNQLRSELQRELQLQLDKYQGEWSDEEIAETNKKLAVGAIRYGMLASDPNKDIVFDMKNWLSFDGDTGPYLMYSYARTKSILRKATERGLAPSYDHLSLLTTSEEGEVLSFLHGFNETVLIATHQYKPSTLCHYLFDMCKAYNRFHIGVPVLRAETPELAKARLALIESFCAVLHQGLGLLGITPPERM
jgi:arginyl-tRNA synthetase